MTTHHLEKQLDLIIKLLETLPSRIVQASEKHRETIRENEATENKSPQKRPKVVQ
jgi:hypothetical protein